ncbi:MAG TPA: sugar porter family MFS transporter [Candidatus Acidoferrales bacterium]|jgi:sugar porter (SP) family MFS transporter|nr:sugar porter family MFS transporter [Candidatus Acidoferrales bacterium]
MAVAGAETTGPQNPHFVTIVAAVSALAGLLFGYDTGVISGAVLFVQQDFHLTTFQEETVVSAVLLGAMIGAALGGRLADRFGRRAVLIQVALLFIVGALGTALAPNEAWLAVGRIVVGIAIGTASFTAPLYISEISPAGVRGKLVSLNQLMITIGIVCSYLSDYALADMRGWRWMFGLAAVPAVILLAGLMFVPESPRWFMRQLARDRARAVLEKIRRPSEVDEELSEIEASLNQQQGGWHELLSPSLRPALVIGIGLAVFQQFTGINTVIYYAPTIFRLAGLHSNSAAILATVGVGVVNVLLTIVALELLDRVGRRPLLLYGLVGMIVSLGILGAAFLSSNPTSALAWTSVICVGAYVACFAISLGPIFWLMIAEIYPLKIRSRAMAVATMANWGSNLLVALTFLSLLHVLGRPSTFWLYALVGVIAWIFVLRLVPETKGKTLEEIESIWRARQGTA